ncbi:hypothetical protein D3C84_421780 [compost metagenome]
MPMTLCGLNRSIAQPTPTALNTPPNWNSAPMNAACSMLAPLSRISVGNQLVSRYTITSPMK